MKRRLFSKTIVMLCLIGAASGWQSSKLPSTQATAFLGTWVIAMSNPAGATETVRIREENGVVAASVQSGRFPPINATGAFVDGDTLLLTLTRFENGKPDRAVIALTVTGGVVNMSQMLEFSTTIKRGTGNKSGSTPPAK